MESYELKPCPFCGSEDIGMNKRLEENFVLRNGVFKRQTVSERYQIKCRSCPCGTYFAFYLEDAVEAWNRRSFDKNEHKKGKITMKKLLSILFAVLIAVSCLTACTEADNVNHNLSQAADNFECLRKITVYNARTDLIVMEMEGFMSLSNTSTSELVVTCRTGANEYKKNYIYLNEYVIYVVEDITGTVTDPYHYKVYFYTALPDIDINE